ncbi:MAG: glycosyltransferase family 2 protein [Gammaproteobacteria bacterium]
MPTLSLITATFNAGATLADCLSSVAGQTAEVEHVVVDGVSSDNTLEVAREFDQHISLLISEKDRGLYDAMNKGIAAATGDVIGILNADDFYPDDQVLARVAQAFEDPEVQLSYGDLRYVEADDVSKTLRTWRAGECGPRSFYWGWMPPHPTVFVRRSVYEEFGVFDLEQGSAADYELMLRFMLKHGVQAQYIPHFMVHMRAGGVSNASWGNRWRANRKDREAWRRNDLTPYPWTIAAKPARKIVQWLVR